MAADGGIGGRSAAGPLRVFGPSRRPCHRPRCRLLGPSGVTGRAAEFEHQFTDQVRQGRLLERTSVWQAPAAVDPMQQVAAG